MSQFVILSWRMRPVERRNLDNYCIDKIMSSLTDKPISPHCPLQNTDPILLIKILDWILDFEFFPIQANNDKLVNIFMKPFVMLLVREGEIFPILRTNS